MSNISRRSFLQSFAASGAIASPSSGFARFQDTRPPNLLVLVTDQQSATMLSSAGNPWLKTPSMDSLAQTGVRFERAYCTDPVCLPSRFSFLTGRYPSAVGVRHNGSKPTALVDSMPRKAMGHLFRSAGYETVYGGKVHLPGPMKDIASCGFDVLTNDQRDELANQCVSYLRADHEKPFLMFASFINPHDICYMAIRDYEGERRKPPPALDKALELPPGVGDSEFFRKYCPPLPANFEIPKEEPDAISWLTKLRPFRQNARENWNEERWRLHRWAYCRLTERVDAQIGRVLKALEDSGLAGNTLVVLTSDHGDMDSAHRMEHKTAFYEEATLIPLIVRAPGRARPAQVNRDHLVSNGLDLIPTLCDYAGVATPAGLQGRSLRPLIENGTAPGWRDTLFVESEIGYMVTDGRFKYCAYDPDKGGRRESLVDLKTDPGEMTNLVSEKASRNTIHRMRGAMADWQAQNGIQFEIPS